MLLQATTLVSDSILYALFLVGLALQVSNKGGVANMLTHRITAEAADKMCNFKIFRNVGATVTL